MRATDLGSRLSFLPSKRIARVVIGFRDVCAKLSAEMKVCVCRRIVRRDVCRRTRRALVDVNAGTRRWIGAKWVSSLATQPHLATPGECTTRVA